MKTKKLLSVVFLLSLVVSFTSVTPNINATQIPEGAIIKTEHNPDVYIVKYKNGKQFKRLVLNPQVFESYGHLKWEDIQIVDRGAVDLFITSDLVRVDGQTDIYQLEPNGDIGNKYLLESTIGYDLDSAYVINAVDFGNYELISTQNLSSTLTMTEISDISKTIVYVECYFENDKIQSGSGVLSEFENPPGNINYLVKTNAHVIFDVIPDSKNPPKVNCTVSLPHIEASEKIGFESIYSTSLGWFGYEPERHIDKAWLYLENALYGNSDLNKRVQDKITRSCFYKKTGMEIYVFGYPGYAISNNIPRLISTRGVISGNTGRGYDDSGREILESYFTTAQIDSGNSGGLAITKLTEAQTGAYGTLKKGDICIIGVPTWTSVGEYVNVGLIQNE
ncbi:hypothetical protein KAI56_04025 [Candidatus Parcubacteria bacterium]|nr:hypothetical protein [Candidatus Parcubacteria bacterium]